jgi:hypothetical protein
MPYSEPPNEGFAMNQTERNVTAVACLILTGVQVVKSLKTIRTERAKRAEIQRNLELDLEAIALAGERMSEKLADKNSAFRSLADLEADMTEEIQFQQMIVRYKD